MTPDEVLSLYNQITESFNAAARHSELHLVEWNDFLKRQDYAVAKLAVDWHTKHSGATFMPTIAQLNKTISERQAEISAKHALAKNSLTCRICEGETWEEILGDWFPCSDCRTTSYERWEDGYYQMGAMLNMDEVDGPKQSYQVAAQARFNTGPDVSAIRAGQWKDHIESNSSDPYPESETLDIIKKGVTSERI